MFKREIHTCENTIIKSDHPDLMRVEVEKTQQAFEIGKTSGLFRVPRILDYHEDKGVAIFERLHGIHDIGSIITSGCKSGLLLEAIGKSLACIHKELILPKDMVWPLPTELQLPGSEVFIHGDFNGVNVCRSQDDNSIVILDWQMTQRFGGQSTFGSLYFDLMWFINYFFWRTFNQFRLNIPTALMAKIFLGSYFKISNYKYDQKEISKYMRKFFKFRLAFKKESLTWKRRILLMPNYAWLVMFLASFRL